MNSGTNDKDSYYGDRYEDYLQVNSRDIEQVNDSCGFQIQSSLSSLLSCDVLSSEDVAQTGIAKIHCLSTLGGNSVTQNSHTNGKQVDVESTLSNTNTGYLMSIFNTARGETWDHTSSAISKTPIGPFNGDSTVVVQKNRDDSDEKATASLNNLKPRRPLSAYNFFFQQERQAILEQKPIRAAGKPRRSHGKIGFADLARCIATKWKSLSDEEKEPFEVLAASEKELYLRKINEWRRTQKLKSSNVTAFMPQSFNTESSLGNSLVGTGIEDMSGRGVNECPSKLQKMLTIGKNSLMFSKKFGKIPSKVLSKNTIMQSDSGINTIPSLTVNSSLALNRSQLVQGSIKEVLSIVETLKVGNELMINSRNGFRSSSIDRQNNVIGIQSTYQPKQQHGLNTFESYEHGTAMNPISRTGFGTTKSSTWIPSNNTQAFRENDQQLAGFNSQSSQYSIESSIHNTKSSPDQLLELATKLDDESTELLLDLFR